MTAIKLSNEQYALTQDGYVNLFSDKETANAYITSASLTSEEVNESIGTCFRCGSPLFPTDIPEQGYACQCFTCDEDFFTFEQPSLLTGEAI